MRLLHCLAIVFFLIACWLDPSLASMHEEVNQPQNKTKMKALILGGTNFIGPHVAKILHDKGLEIYMFHRGKTARHFTFPVQHIYGDRKDLLNYKDQFAKLSFSVVIDMFPYSESDAQTLLKVLEYLKIHLVIVSSVDVYQAYNRLWNLVEGPIEEVPLHENSKLRGNLFPENARPKGPDGLFYDYDKLLVETVILNEPSINCTILRLPFVYGPGDYWRIWGYLQRLDEGRPILLDENKAQWKASRCYVEDVALAIALAALNPKAGKNIYNVSEEELLSEIEWIRTIAKAAGKEAHIITMPAVFLSSHLREPLCWAQPLVMNSTLIRSIVGYKEELSVDERMERSIEWLHSHPCSDKGLLASLNYGEEDKALHHFEEKLKKDQK